MTGSVYTVLHLLATINGHEWEKHQIERNSRK